MLYFKYSGQKTFIETPLPELVIFIYHGGIIEPVYGIYCGNINENIF